MYILYKVCLTFSPPLVLCARIARVFYAINVILYVMPFNWFTVHNSPHKCIRFEG